MASPALLGIDGVAKASNVICGALSASFAVIAIWEATRGLRWVNMVVGCWLLVSVLLFEFQGGDVIAIVVSGVVLISMSLIRGAVTQQIGGGWLELIGREK